MSEYYPLIIHSIVIYTLFCIYIDTVVYLWYIYGVFTENFKEG